MPIQVGDNFSYKGTKPLDARTKYATVADMKNATASDLYDGCLAYVDATKKNYQYDSSNTVDPDTGKWRELQTGGGGTTYTAGDGIVIENAEISVDEMASSDMEEIVTPLPSVMSRRFKYSTSEQIVGEWIDGKPIYQKTFQITVPSTTDGNMVDGVYDVLDLNIDKCIYAHRFSISNTGFNFFYHIGARNRCAYYFFNSALKSLFLFIYHLGTPYYLVFYYNFWLNTIYNKKPPV